MADKAEEALSRDGLVCIAAGMLGSIHKSYFAAQLRNSSEWFMLELVLHWDTVVAQVASFEPSFTHHKLIVNSSQLIILVIQATFRCSTASWVSPLCEHFVAVLDDALSSSLVGVQD